MVGGASSVACYQKYRQAFITSLIPQLVAGGLISDYGKSRLTKAELRYRALISTGLILAKGYHMKYNDS